jgi:hypothetical protein
MGLDSIRFTMSTLIVCYISYYIYVFKLFFALIINKQKLIIKIVVKIQDHIW